MYQKTIGLYIFYGKHEDSKCITYFFGLYFQFIMISLKTRNHSYCQLFLKKPFQRRFLSGKMFFFSYEVAKKKEILEAEEKNVESDIYFQEI